MWQEIIRFMLDTIKNISEFWNWLTTPLTAEFLGVTYLSIAPIEILGIGGFVTIIIIWLAKLVNPLS